MDKSSLITKKPLIIALGIVVAALIIFGVSTAMTKPAAQDQAAQETVVDENEKFTVPQVVSLTQSDAEKAIVASGLQVGKVTKKSSNTVPRGNVISQDPKGLTEAKANSKVNLVVSTGKKKAKEVAVPDLKGKTQAEAKKALTDAKLVVASIKSEETTEVDPGLVFKQSVKAGTKVEEGSKVGFTVAVAPSEVAVPNVVGMTRDDAKAALTKVKLGFDSVDAYNDKVPAGKVISQSVEAGSKVKAGSVVSVTVSLGAKPAEKVTVPDVMSYTWNDAQAAMRSAGLAVRYTGDPDGIVVAQDVAAGTKVAPNTLVTVTLESPTQMVAVPNVVGESVATAGEKIDAAGLGFNPSSTHGTVTDQSPAAGTMVEAGTTVSVTVDDSEFRGDEVSADDYMGSWYAGRASMQISNVGSKINVTINWSSSANESYSWSYNCDFKDGKLVSGSNGTKTHVVVDEDGDTSDTEYTNGKATFTLSNGSISWQDSKEGAGDGLSFTR